MTRNYLLALLAGSLIFSCTFGCQKTTDESTSVENEATDTSSEKNHHDEDDVLITADDVERPTSYSDAISRIQAYRDTIRDSIAAGNPSKAHRPLDELNFVLEWLPEIAVENNIPKESWESINTTSQQLRDLFDKVHAQIDANEEPDYEAVSSDVETGINSLEMIQ